MLALLATLQELSTEKDSQMHRLPRDILQYLVTPLVAAGTVTAVPKHEGSMMEGFQFMFIEPDNRQTYQFVFAFHYQSKMAVLIRNNLTTGACYNHARGRDRQPETPYTAAIVQQMLNGTLHYDKDNKMMVPAVEGDGLHGIRPTAVTYQGIIAHKSEKWYLVDPVTLLVNFLYKVHFKLNLIGSYISLHVMWEKRSTREHNVYKHIIHVHYDTKQEIELKADNIMSAAMYKDKYVLVATMQTETPTSRYEPHIDWVLLDFNGCPWRRPTISVINRVKVVGIISSAHTYIDEGGRAHMYTEGVYTTWDYRAYTH